MIFYLLAILAVVSALPQPKVITNPRYAYNQQNTKIINGVEASLGEFPWMVSLQNSGSHFCAGSLIDTKNVITAAHCTSRNAVTVALGAIDYKYPEQIIDQYKFNSHPLYNSATFDYDYAVITLKDYATLGANIQTIKLAAAGVDYNNGMASISGWGYTNQFLQSAPRIMHKADISLMSQAECQAILDAYITITARMQCAGGKDDFSSCELDSGGSLTVMEDNEPILVGVVSWVHSSCSPEYPGGYAKISAVRQWIYSVTN